MLRQWMRFGLLASISVVVVFVAACGGSPSGPAAPPAPHGLSSEAGDANTDNAWAVLSQSSRVATPVASTPAAPAAPEVMSPAEAQAAAPFAFGVPAWAPPGFELQPQAELIAPPASDAFASVALSWQNAAGASIGLVISQDKWGLGLTGTGTDPQPVQIGSQLGSLSRQSGFAADRLVLDWTLGALSYRLSADAEAVSREDLVRMAESVS